MKVVLLSVLLLVGGGVNAVLYADCEKCCGGYIVEGVAHRYCDEENETGWCHVTECAAYEPCGSCWWIERLNDVCSGFGSGDAGMHNCGL